MDQLPSIAFGGEVYEYSLLEVISADFAENLMKQISWEDAEERQVLEKVIAARRKADAEKPPPAEMLW